MADDLFRCDGCGIISDNGCLLGDGAVVCSGCANAPVVARCECVVKARTIGSDGKCEEHTADGYAEVQP